MAAIPKRRIEPWEYLALERAAPFRSEYYDGNTYAMAGSSVPHDDIVTNLLGELYTALRDLPCRHHSADMKLSHIMGFSYPDASIVCGDPQYVNEEGEALLNPLVIFEVLSDSTEAFCRGLKFDWYKSIASFRDYFLVAQDRVLVEHYSKGAEGKWKRKKYDKREAVIPIKSAGIALSVGALYAKVRFKLAKK